MTMDPTVVTTAPLKSFVYRASPVQLFIWRRSEHAVLVPPSITTCPETLVAGSGRLAGHQSKVRPFHTPGTCGGGEEYFGQRVQCLPGGTSTACSERRQMKSWTRLALYTNDLSGAVVTTVGSMVITAQHCPVAVSNFTPGAVSKNTE
eukprot:gene9480-biopygen9261